ncbi:DUF2442 domain-containing protein [Sphingobium terrigena]|uniref:DUF2442 domain-containing protein n=1 Tax=Sphingobium terrigena TaxID=2304063 RepID=A0A418YSN0_9SPHN|nr:DUF2442 domain-containing protein [Sphingobium terrigena]RJG54855.1 DUF2442 domain-containing protein [Sphingobium terrigena]
MTITDKSRTITAVRATGAASLHLDWSDGIAVDVDLGPVLGDRAFAALREADAFAQVEVGDWGHSLSWPCGVEIGADFLWLEALSATGHGDARAFIEWRMRHGLSLSKAADALGVSRRMVAYYSNGEKKVPRAILLACRGWEVSEGLGRAA